MAEREQEVALARDGDVVGDGSDKGTDQTELCSDLGRPSQGIVKKKKEKLLILSFSGLLVHRVHKIDSLPKNREPDTTYQAFHFYKRPFLHEFMRFCLDRFEVGIWSTDRKNNVDAVVDILMKDLKEELLFVMGKEECTSSGSESLQSRQNPIYFKDLNNVFEIINSDATESQFSYKNTLLIEPSSHKALLNPDNSGIYPVVYDPNDKVDRLLDPKGELCSYLDELKDASDIQYFVKRRRFGPKRVGRSHSEWSMYSEAVSSVKKSRRLNSIVNYFYNLFT